ncbi:TRIM71 [Mytilus edulis]|uniref:TRIM71 n=1 Tax=Mytilus edulis TaxID=6550 RepID=A0A8S3VCF4_MYTED|nr:TRIM71 [Mytilus edulis]
MDGHLSARLGTVRCSNHRGQRPEYFCCEQLICSLCQVGHSNHESLCTIETKRNDIQESVPYFLTKLGEVRANTDRQISNYESMLERNSREQTNNKKNIHKRIQGVIDYLKKIESSLKEDFQQIKTSCERIPSFNSALETVRVGVRVNQQLGELDSKDNHQPLPQIPEFISPHNLPGNGLLRKIIGTMNDGLDMDSDWTTDENEKFEIKEKFEWKQKRIGISPLGRDRAWLYPMDTGGNIFLISQKGELVKEIKNEKRRKIEKIHTTNRMNAWVTDIEKCSIKVLRETGELEHRFHVAPFHPFGICPTKSGEAVWICLADKSSFIPELKGRTMVAKMTTFGEKVCEIESPGGKTHFTFPYRCTENINEDLIVVDRIKETKGQIFIFDKSCQLKCGYIGTSVDREFDPHDVCCNSKGNIIISDYSNHAIHILSLDGVLERLLKMDSKEFLHPLSVATDDIDRVWITFHDGKYNVIIINNYVNFLERGT